jgi:hypothetical protein
MSLACASYSASHGALASLTWASVVLVLTSYSTTRRDHTKGATSVTTPVVRAPSERSACGICFREVTPASDRGPSGVTGDLVIERIEELAEIADGVE